MKLRLTRRATAQLDKILGDLASQSPQGAANVSARVSDGLELLQPFPVAGRQVLRHSIRRITIDFYIHNLDHRM